MDVTTQFAEKTASSNTKPGYLIEIAFKSGAIRYSTRGFQTWNTFTWASSPWEYVTGRLTIRGGSPPIASLLIAQGTEDLPVKVWLFYGDTPTEVPSGPLLVFDGFADGATDLVDTINVPLYTASARGLFTPRLRIIPTNGFNVLPAPGTKIQWAGATFEIPDKW